MNQLIPAGTTMTSREIADLVESRHDSVKRTIERLVENLIIASPPLVDGEKSANNQVERVYLVGKRDSYIIVAQLSPLFTARLVDRWQELENGATHNRQLSTIEILQIAMQSEQERIRLTAELEAAAPAIAFVDKYVDSTGTKGFRQVCKLLKVKEPEFRIFLSDAKVMYKLGGEWVPYAEHIDAGRFQVNAGTADTGHAYNSSRFTPKGINWVAGEYAKYQIRGVA